MALWWIGNIVFLFVIIPLVILLLNRVLAPAVEIKKYADDIVEHGSGLVQQLDSVEELLRTRELVRQAGAGVQQYGTALSRLL